MKTKIIDQSIFFSYCLLMVSFFLPLKYNSISLILIGLISLTKLKYIVLKHKNHSIIVLFCLFFAFIVGGIFYTENLKEGWSIVERHYSLLFIPFFAPTFGLLTINQRKRIINVFIFTLICVSLYCLVYAIVDYFKTGSVYIPGYSGYPIYNKFMHHRLVEPVNMHAIFFSLYLSFSTIIILYRLIKNFNHYNHWEKLGYSLIIAYLLVFLILLKSSLFAFALPIAIGLLFIFYFRDKLLKSKRTKSLFIALIVLIGTFSFYGVSSKINDFSINFRLDDPTINSFKIRLGIWTCSWETIKESWFLGYGTGDANNALYKTYQEKNFIIGIEDKFNAHNMYLQYWMSNGILALLIYLSILLFFAVNFLKKGQIVGFLTVFLFAMFSLTESTMLKQNGIVFFILFSTIFYYKNFQSKTEKESIVFIED